MSDQQKSTENRKTLSKNLSWEMQAEQVNINDPLLECLAILSSENGRRTTATALAAGLPVPRHGIASPQLFVRAAQRVSMRARMLRKSLDYLCQSGNLPCILLLDGDHACILRKTTGNKLEITYPETPDQIATITKDDLAGMYRGYTFFATPMSILDERAGSNIIEEGRDWFWSAIFRHKSIYLQVVLAALFVNIFALVSPLFMMNVYDRVLPNAAFETLWMLATGVVLAYGFDFLLKNLRAHFLDIAGRKADNVISARIFEQLLGMRMDARPPSAGMQAANMREFETIRDFFTSATMVSLIDFPFLILFLILIFLLGGPIAIIPAVMVPIVLICGLFLQKKLNKAIQEAMKESGYKTSLTFETLTGLETLKIHAAEGYSQRKWEELVEHASITNIKTRRINAFAVNFSALAANLASVGVVIYGCYLAQDGLSMGALIACVILTGRAMAPLGQMAGLLTRLGQSKEAFARLDQFMKAPVERPMGQNFASKPILDGRIEFKDVSFSYPNQNRQALREINFTVQAKQKIGIIGAVGSGKTTLERLLLNLYQPSDGSVIIDDVDVRQIDPADLRRNIGVVQQDPMLFFGSVRDNITLGYETVAEEAVYKAAKLAGVMDFLKESEAGLDTQVGERGEMLSGGQRQAIAIARALLYDPPILLLDEPTASIDPGSERKLYKYLKEICADKTVLLITHKSSVLGLVDQLIVMDRGHIITQGPREAVLKQLQSGALAKTVKDKQETTS